MEPNTCWDCTHKHECAAGELEHCPYVTEEERQEGEKGGE